MKLGILAGGRRWVSGGLQIALVCPTLGATPAANTAPPLVTPAAAPASADTDRMDIQRQVAEQEYRASPNLRGLQAPNRAHNLRAYFEPEGVRLNDRTAPGEPEPVTLRLAALGRAGLEQVVPPGRVSSEGPRVEIRRPGLTEWYVNGSVGLEQGFTLDRRPGGDGRLSLKLALSSGSVRSAGIGAALLRAPSGRELNYAGLAAVDFAGRSLSAELRVTAPHELRIEVDDAGAIYPLTVDPILTNAVLQSDQVNAQLGLSVAGAGDVNGDGYDDVIVGAPYYDAGQQDEGAAFVFLARPRSGGIVSGNPLTANGMLQGNQANAHLGYSVAGAGDVNGDGYDDVIVGAYGYSGLAESGGAAFVFLGGPAGIANGSPATAKTKLQSAQPYASMGGSVASAGDVNRDGYADVIVGAESYQVSAQLTFSGAAFVFRGGPLGIPNGSTTSASAVLLGTQTNARTGESVAGAGDVNGDGYADVIVGAPCQDGCQGAAFVFMGGPLGIVNSNVDSASAKLSGTQTEEDTALMGWSVAGVGDVNGDGYADIVVGAPRYDFGYLLGVPGGAFIFLGGPSGIGNGDTTTANTTLQGNQSYALMGFSVAGAGDVNGDGYADVIVGAPVTTAGQWQEGAAYVFFGGPAGIPGGNPTTADEAFQGNQADAACGWSVAGAGDVNADGYADIIIGAPAYDAGQSGEGRAVVIKGWSH